MDYRDLLKRFIAFVGEEEGFTFLGRLSRDRDAPGAPYTSIHGNSVEFTEEEYEALMELERESEDVSTSPGTKPAAS